jgi:hypothetical protein
VALDDKQCCATAEYDYEGKSRHLFTTHAELCRLSEAVQTLFPMIAGVPEDHEILIDFYVSHSAGVSDPEALQQEVRSIINQAGIPRPIRRIVTSITDPAHNHDVGSTQHFTYRPSANTYQEEKFFRGIHPMMGKRLHLWRLDNFNIDRLPSVEDVYLLHAVARDNPKDERFDAGSGRERKDRSIAAPGAHVHRSVGRHPAISIAASGPPAPLLESDFAECFAPAHPRSR